MKGPVFLPSLLALGAVLASGCVKAPEAEPASRPVTVARAEGGSSAEALRYAATIEAKAQVSLAFTVSGYVESIADLEPGNAVRRGTVLARVRQADYRERVNQAKGQLEEAKASLEKSRLDAERAERLYAARSLTRPDYDAARLGADAARARVATAEAALETAEVVLRDATLQSPMDSVLVARNVERGTFATPGAPAFVLADVSRVKARFGVPDRVVGTLEPGGELSVKVEEETYSGRIRSISPAADDRSRLFLVEVEIDNAEGKLKPGTVATVVVRETAAQTRASVPLAAVVKSDEGEFAVFVVEGHGEAAVARRRGVRLGGIEGDRVVVEDGLTGGESVVVRGATLLVDGEAVRVIR